MHEWFHRSRESAYRGRVPRHFRVLAVLATVALTLTISTVCMPHARAVDVSGDDANDQFVGSGQSTARAPGTGSSSGSHHSCHDCRWQATEPCPAGSSSINCGIVGSGCPTGQVLRLIWFSDDGGATWENRGPRCLGASGGADSRPAAQAIHERFARAVPAAEISCQPAQGLLPQVPTLFSSGQPAHVPTSTHTIGGRQIRLSPVAHWHWDFGDGAVLDTQLAGSRFPDLSVSHIYRESGTFQVRLRTTWTATYTVDGQGPFPVEGTVTQSATATIRVGQGRAVLS